jgi:hypothetical protein
LSYEGNTTLKGRPFQAKTISISLFISKYSQIKLKFHLIIFKEVISNFSNFI